MTLTTTYELAPSKGGGCSKGILPNSVSTLLSHFTEIEEDSLSACTFQSASQLASRLLSTSCGLLQGISPYRQGSSQPSLGTWNISDDPRHT